MSGWKRAGVTLAELLVAMLISSLLLTAVLTAFVSTGRLMQWVGARSDLGSSALLGLTMLSREVRASAWQTCTITSSTVPEPALCFQIENLPSATSLTPAFTPAAYEVVYYYNSRTQTLIRKIWPATDQANPVPTPAPPGLRMQTADLQSVLTTTNGTEHTVATGVLSVQVTPSEFPTNAPADGIQVTLNLAKPVNTTQTVTDSVQTVLYPKNHP